METLESDKEKSKEEYVLLLAIFRKFVDTYESSSEKWEIIEEIITLRASFLIDRVIKGLNLDFKEVLVLLKGNNNLVSNEQAEQRKILIAGIDNLIDFAAAEEQQMLEELSGGVSEDDKEEYEIIFKKYNLTYASLENQDVLYAASVAAWWMTIENETLVTFMTQGDDRVRAWHLSHEGLSFLKRNFPPELIPPIEWGCRCYLITDRFSSVYASKYTDHQISVNPVFSESLATGGKIFSDMHPYFQTPRAKNIQTIVDRIKQKFYLI